ncbi:MAG: quinone-dependent dihydroorotate dehydrogenase, partial [Pseudonocardiaceae bacterium]
PSATFRPRSHSSGTWGISGLSVLTSLRPVAGLAGIGNLEQRRAAGDAGGFSDRALTVDISSNGNDDCRGRLMYKLLFLIFFRRVPAVTAHRLGLALLRGVTAVPGWGWVLGRWFAPGDPVLGVHALGFDLPGPLGLAAGFDKDARGADALGAVGFAYVEIGTVTAQPQSGNLRPRLFRLPEDRALLNRMGFNNAGSVAAAARLRARGHGVVVGVNIAKTKVVPENEAVADYVASAKLLAEVADYLVVNVSSPNTPGLRDLQAVEHLRPLLTGVREALDGAAGARRVPLLVKIAPDLAEEDVDAVAELALELGRDGIIATNTTISRNELSTDAARVEELGAGGVSGAALRDRSLAVLRRLRGRVGNRLVLVAVGGIQTPDDAWARIQAGATLVQGYTGFVYGGPLWPRRIHRGLARHVRRAGHTSISDAIGSVSPDSTRQAAVVDGLEPLGANGNDLDEFMA